MSAMRGRRLNLSFLGCGEVTAAHSRRLARFRDRVRCFYASRDAEKAMAFERRFGGGGSFASYDAALADGRIDAVFVATPPATHFELAREALGQGKDVIVEKPAFTCAADFDRIDAAQAKAGRRVFVAENYCYKPLARVLRDTLASGAIGEVRFLQVNALKRQTTAGWRNDPGRAHGALFEGGTHWIDLMAHLGPPLRSVRGFRPGDGRGPERSMLVVVEYADGAVGALAHSWEVPSPMRGLRLSRIHGTAGSIVFESNGLFVLVYGRCRRVLLPGWRDVAGYDAMFRDFFEALATGRPPVMTLERARRDLELVAAAYGDGPA
jgi:predicted dehydrogenase